MNKGFTQAFNICLSKWGFLTADPDQHWVSIQPHIHYLPQLFLNAM